MIPIKQQIVFFDMDGLLFDTERTAIQMIARKSFERGWHLPFRAFQRASGRNYEDCLRITREEAGEGYPYPEIWAETSATMRELSNAGKIPLKSGALGLLNLLKELNHPCWLVTSSSQKRAENLLQGAQIDSYFKGMTTGEAVEKGKPAPDIYLKALSETEGDPSLSIAFEDSNSGGKAALGAQLKTIIVPDLEAPQEEIQGESSAVIGSLLILTGMIEQKMRILEAERIDCDIIFELAKAIEAQSRLKKSRF